MVNAETMSEWTIIITAKDKNQFICQIMKYALDFDPEVITIFFQIWIKKFYKAYENGLTSLLQYVISPKSINYEVILIILVSNSLNFELVSFFLDQTLGAGHSHSLYKYVNIQILEDVYILLCVKENG